MPETVRFNYRAFLSYSHPDTRSTDMTGLQAELEAAFRKLPIAPPDDGRIPYEWVIPGIGRQLALMKPVDCKVASPDAAKRKLGALKKHPKTRAREADVTELVLSEKGKNPSVSIDKIVKFVQAKDPLFTRERISYRGTAMLRYDMLRDDRTDGGDRRAASRNVLGEPLEICSLKPMTGFYRDGCCDTGREDFGSHTVCVVLIPDFSSFPNRAVTIFRLPCQNSAFQG